MSAKGEASFPSDLTDGIKKQTQRHKQVKGQKQTRQTAEPMLIPKETF